MERQVAIGPYQQVTPEDYNNFGGFPTFALDNLARDAITDGKAFVGFTVIQSGPAEVTVGAGRYWKDGERFFAADEGGVSIDLLALLPAVTRRIVRVAVWGDEVITDLEARSYINPETKVLTAKVEGTERRRIANIDRVPGQENVDPQPPVIQGNALGIADILLDPTGIVSITMIEENRLVSLKTINTRLTFVERTLEQTGSQIETLRTDISALANAQKQKASLTMVRQMAFTLATLSREAELPNDYLAWDSDNFEDAGKSSPAYTNVPFPNYRAVTSHGLRFHDGGVNRAAFVLQNQIDDRITVADNMVSAKSLLKKRISVLGKDGEQALASYQLAGTDLVKMVETRKVIEWTSTLIPKSDISASGWAPYADLDGGPHPQVESFGEMSAYNINAKSYARGYTRVNPATGVTEVMQFNHIEQLQFSGGDSWAQIDDFWKVGVVKTVEDVSWKVNATTINVNGYQAAGTFVNSQSGTIGGINLFFTRKGANGSVKVIIAECTPNGEPDPTRVVVEATLAVADIVADPQGVTPTFVALGAKQLEKGKRYAFWVVTQGAHWIATVSGEKYAQGAAFVYQNDRWNQLGTGIDIPFELFFHEYLDTRVVVPLEAVTLAGGMRYLEANFDKVEPEGTRIELLAKTTGDWFPLPYFDDRTNPLEALPTSVQLAVVMIGTTDDMPKFGIGPVRSCVTMRRPATELKHISEELTFETPVDTIEVRLKGYNFDPADHTLTVKVLRGAGYTTVEAVDVVTDVPSVKLAGGFHTNFLFNLGANITSCRIVIEGAATDAAITPVITERVSIAYAV